MKIPASARTLTVRLLAANSLAWLAGCATEPMAVPAPPPLTVAPLPDTRVYVYPAAGQSAAQLDRDRYECRQWSVQKGGFDPSVAQAALIVLLNRLTTSIAMIGAVGGGWGPTTR